MNDDLRYGACRADGVDPEWFFPQVGQSGEKARSVCAVCRPDTKDACLRVALGEESQPGAKPFGFRGGLSARERRKLLDRGRPEPAHVTQVRRMAAKRMNDTEIGAALGKKPSAIAAIRRRWDIDAGVPCSRHVAAAGSVR